MANKSRIKRKKAAKKTKRRLVIFAPLSVVVIAYFLISSTNYALNIIALKREQRDLEQELVTLKADEKNLKNEIEKLKDPDYIARFARENYLYSKNGEYIIKIDDKTKEEKKKDYTVNDNYLNYVITGCIIFALVVVIWMIRKK